MEVQLRVSTWPVPPWRDGTGRATLDAILGVNMGVESSKNKADHGEQPGRQVRRSSRSSFLVTFPSSSLLGGLK